MEDRMRQEQASPAARKRVQDSFVLQDPTSHLGARITHIGTVLKPGRPLTVCRLDVYGVQADGSRKLVADGRQTLIRVARTAR
ncbi:hypothetical protein [Streptomyces sp. NPDC047974]|uniref:hypothetical protein n=1 Tax=Streptomyces sp. NPDC047974 TaxID=3154343 RepID=UPI0033D469BE